MGKMTVMDKLYIWLAWKLPRRLAYWAADRVMAHATWKHSDREVGTIAMLDALESWEG